MNPKEIEIPENTEMTIVFKRGDYSQCIAVSSEFDRFQIRLCGANVEVKQ